MMMLDEVNKLLNQSAFVFDLRKEGLYGVRVLSERFIPGVKTTYAVIAFPLNMLKKVSGLYEVDQSILFMPDGKDYWDAQDLSVAEAMKQAIEWGEALGIADEDLEGIQRMLKQITKT